MSTISASTPARGVDSGAQGSYAHDAIQRGFRLYGSIAQEAMDLQREGLIGKDSLIGWSMHDTTVDYWSEKDHSQWQAYLQHGSAAAQQAADYQKQMVAERQALANDYLSQVARLASDFGRLNIPTVGFHQVLDRAQAGESILDGVPSGYEQTLQTFWDEHKVQLAQLDEKLKALEAFPSDLEGWLEQQEGPIDDEVHRIVDRLKNGWAEVGKTPVGEDYRPNHMTLQVDSESPEGDGDINLTTDPDVALSMIRSVERIMLSHRQRQYTSSIGDKSLLAVVAARELLAQQLEQTYQEMRVISRDLFPQFSQQFGMSSGYPGFSLQDMIDNYLADKPLAMLDEGTLHPLAGQIEAFWQDNECALKQYASRQCLLNELPNDLEAFMTQNSARVHQYLLDNLNRLLNMTIALDR